MSGLLSGTQRRRSRARMADPAWQEQQQQARERFREDAGEYGSGLLREAYQGATMEFGDELEALLSAGRDALWQEAGKRLGYLPDSHPEQGFWQNYENRHQQIARDRARFQQENPIAATTVNLIGGAVNPLARLGLLSRGVNTGRQIFDKANRMETYGRAAFNGTVQGTITGAGAAEPGERVKGAVQGGALGGAFVAPHAKMLEELTQPVLIASGLRYMPVGLLSKQTANFVEKNPMADTALHLGRDLYNDWQAGNVRDYFYDQ